MNPTTKATSDTQTAMGRLLIVASAILIFAFTTLGQTTVVVNQTNIQGWIFYNDENDKIDPTLGKFVSGPATPPLGSGGVQMSVSGTQRRNLGSYQFSGTPLANITTLAYSTYNPSAGNGGSANRSGFLFFNVDFDGSDTWQRRLTYVPANNGTVLQNTWQEWDAINGGAALWGYSGPTWPGGVVPGTTLKTWAQILSEYPGIRIRVTDSLLGIRVGEPYGDGYTENIDAFKFGTGAGTTFFDFEPATALNVSPAGSPNAFDNDYTRINNAIQAIAPGGTITLSGTYDWTEANASASWALGSDGVTGGSFSDDDWSILAPANLNGVTVTAASLGSARIQGPGDIPSANLEGVFQFYSGGTNQNWTISNLEIFDFDNAIGFYFAGGPTTVYSGTQILNNHIRTARDLNATVAPADVNQNIGIHFSFGQNQLISGNTIDFYGDGISDSANLKYSTEVGMQSNTSGGNVYNGLQITNNTLRVLNAQSADPEVILGIWENAHGHGSNINVSGNSFVNLDGGNNPATNLQRGFRVTSHSTGSTTVTYSGNDVSGANIGFQWITGSNFAAQQPVVFTSNVITGNATGVVVQSSGKATMTFNRIAGNSVSGLENVDGSVTAENNWWGCNYGPGAGGAGCSVTANGILGTVSYSNWLTLTSSATPSSILNGNNSAVTSKLTINSASVDTSGSGTVRDGTPMSFAGSLGTVAPGSSTTTAGVSGTTFTATSVGAGGTSTTTDAQTVSAAIAIQPACNNVSIATGQTTLRNALLSIPITIDSTTGQEIYSYDFTYTYDPAVLTYTGYSTVGTLSSGFTITPDNSTPGTLVVSGFGASPLAGAGTLLNVNFTASGVVGSSSNLTLSPFMLNEGSPWCSNVSNGDIRIISGSIAGTVTYLNQDGQNPQPRTVPNVLMSGAGTPNVSTSTNGSGVYNLSGFGNSTYTVTPSRTAEVYTNANTGISANDAARIAQHVVGTLPLTSNQQLAADVSNNGTITSFDSSVIARWFVGLPAPGVTGTWRFVPTSRNYTVAQIETGLSGEDYSAILMGDVTGNWNVPPPLWESLTDFDRERAIDVSVPEIRATTGSEVLVPVQTGDTTGKGAISYDFALRYNPDVLEVGKNPCDLANTLSSTMSVTCNSEEPGLIRIAVFGVNELIGKGDLLSIRFNVIGAARSASDLELIGFKYNESQPFSTVRNGRITVTEASSDDSIGGRVLTATGQPVQRARIRITDLAGNFRETMSNQFGTFRFSGLGEGQTYTIAVTARGMTFLDRSVTVGDGATSVEIIAEP